MRKRSWKNVAAITAFVAGFAGDATAQPYPDRIVEVLIPGTPGNSADIVGRVLLEGMSTYLGQRFLPLNKPGAGGVVATNAVAQAKSDGYMLLHGAAWTLTAAPLTELYTPYTRGSFEPICQTFKNDQVIVARPNTYKNVADLIAATKARPGGLNYGTPGLGSIPHLAMVELSQVAKAEFNQVSFRGSSEAVQMTVAGQIDFGVIPLTAAASAPLVMPGLFATRRNPSIPDVPTVAEQGFDVAPLSIGGLYAPAGIPAGVKDKLETACMAAMQTDAFKLMAKNTLQPGNFNGDSRVFSMNIDKDMEDKRRLLTSLGLAKR